MQEINHTVYIDKKSPVRWVFVEQIRNEKNSRARCGQVGFGKVVHVLVIFGSIGKFG